MFKLNPDPHFNTAGSGSAFRKTAGSGSAKNECGYLVPPQRDVSGVCAVVFFIRGAVRIYFYHILVQNLIYQKIALGDVKTIKIYIYIIQKNRILNRQGHVRGHAKKLASDGKITCHTYKLSSSDNAT